MTISKKRKFKEKILNALKDKAELSTDEGEIVNSKFSKLNKKARRHSGRYTPQIFEKGKISEMIANAEEPKEEYDDWVEYRDGYRGDSDGTKLMKGKGSFWQDPEEIKKRNKKIRKQLAIRKAKKEKNQRFSPEKK